MSEKRTIPLCDDCKFVRGITEHLHCRRFPPQVLSIFRDRYDDSGRPVFETISRWPNVYYADECGEFQPRSAKTPIPPCTGNP